MAWMMQWQRSSFCESGACLEVAREGNFILVRDSKNPDQEPHRFHKNDWSNFVERIAAERRLPS
jgi:hypothetical protein